MAGKPLEVAVTFTFLFIKRRMSLLCRLTPHISASILGHMNIASTVNHALYASHWMLFVGFAQLLIGISFLSNRFVPVALIMMAAFLYNSFAYHVTTSPALLALPLLATALSFLVVPYRLSMKSWLKQPKDDPQPRVSA